MGAPYSCKTYISHKWFLLRYIFPRVCRYTFSHFCSFMVIWRLGLGLGGWGWGFQLMGFGAFGVGSSGFFRARALYINIEE